MFKPNITTSKQRKTKHSNKTKQNSKSVPRKKIWERSLPRTQTGEDFKETFNSLFTLGSIPRGSQDIKITIKSIEPDNTIPKISLLGKESHRINREKLNQVIRFDSKIREYDDDYSGSGMNIGTTNMSRRVRKTEGIIKKRSKSFVDLQRFRKNSDLENLSLVPFPKKKKTKRGQDITKRSTLRKSKKPITMDDIEREIEIKKKRRQDHKRFRKSFMTGKIMRLEY